VNTLIVKFDKGTTEYSVTMDRCNEYHRWVHQGETEGRELYERCGDPAGHYGQHTAYHADMISHWGTHTQPS